MKKLLLPLFLLLIVSVSGTAQTQTPIEYNDAIIDEQDKISKVMLEMASYFGTDLDKAEMYRKDLVLQCEASVAALRKLPAYGGSTAFRDAGVALFSFYRDICDKEYKEMIAILKKTDISTADIERLTVLEKEVSEREKVLDDAFQEAQNAFAKKYGLRLQENEYQQEIDQLGK